MLKELFYQKQKDKSTQNSDYKTNRRKQAPFPCDLGQFGLRLSVTLEKVSCPLCLKYSWSRFCFVLD